MNPHLDATVTDGRVARRVGTREVILAAATELFAARGVTSTSIDDIAEKAGIAKGSIYYNFGSKAGLVEAVLGEHSALLKQLLAEATAGLAGPARRAAVVTALLQAIRSHADAARVMVTEMFRTERSWLESIEAWRSIIQGSLTDDFLAEHPDSSPALASVQAATIIGAALTAGLDWLAFNPELPLENVRDAVLRTLGLPGEPGGR
ncbi:MAG: TetR/AcrR family transcriptional regulator [Propionicimonas sp.]|nr:TetR/AcrR family transcriptional regulator [Propionicimonas sp.]